MSDQYLFGPLKLSELAAQKTEAVHHVFGVEVDAFNPQPVENLRTVGFIARMDSGGFDFDVMDTIIQYHQLHCAVFIEVPFDFAMPAKDVLVMAMSMSANVIVTPPQPGTPEQWKQWSDYTKQFLAAMLDLPTFSQELLPVTSYVEYMSMAVMKYQPKTITDNPLMFEYFEKSMDYPTMDELKAHMHEAILDYHGGEEAFEVMVHSTLASMHDSLSEMGNKALGRIQEALDNGNKEAILKALVSMLQRKDFPSDGSAHSILTLALDHPVGLVAGLEEQLVRLAEQEDETRIGAVAELLDLIRELQKHRKP